MSTNDLIFRLPNEVILLICEELTNYDLLTFSRTTSKMYELCKGLISKRKQEYQNKIRVLWDTIYAHVYTKTENMIFKKETGNISVFVEVNRGRRFLRISQYYTGGKLKDFKLVPSIFSGMKIIRNETARETLIQRNELKGLATNLIRQNYLNTYS